MSTSIRPSIHVNAYMHAYIDANIVSRLVSFRELFQCSVQAAFDSGNPRTGTTAMHEGPKHGRWTRGVHGLQLPTG